MQGGRESSRGQAGGQDDSPVERGRRVRHNGARVIAPGSLILGGRFRIVSSLGSGGMGEVYLGEQVLLGRKVAIKVLHPDVKEQAMMAERFHREARLLSSIDHPSVVRVIEYGQEGDANFLVMEFAEGQTLHSALQDGPLEPMRALGILAQLTEGLAAIHEAGIVHRDLKPENVILTPGVRGEIARLLDFGIARLMAAADSPMSQMGLVLGTPEYLSPEQATGAPVDARSDLYSLGILAYRTLTGVLPFTGPNPRDFLVQHVKVAPVPLETVHPPLAAHPALCAHVLQLLAKEPGRRPESAKLFADALRALLHTPTLSGSHAPLPIVQEFAAPVPTSGTAAFAALSNEEAAPLVSAPGALGAGAGEAGPTRVDAAARAPSGRRNELAAAPGESNGFVAAPAPGAATLTSALNASPRTWLVVGGVAALALVVLLIGNAFSASSVENIRAQIEKGQVDAALKAISDLDKEGPLTPTLHSLRSSALHLKGRHKEEHAKLRALDAMTLAQLEDSVLTSLAEDFGRNESNSVLLKLLASFPEDHKNAVFAGLAESEASAAQWGALRYLDELKRAGSVDLPLAYASALALDDCKVKVVAARRLGKLGDSRTQEALSAVAKAPRARGLFADSRCGQQEAAAALRALEKAEK